MASESELQRSALPAKARLCLLVAAASCAASVHAELEWNYVATIDAGFIDDGRAGAESTVHPELDWRITDWMDINALGRARYSFGDLLEHRPEDAADITRDEWNRRSFSGRAEFELRETYVDVQAGAVFLRLGKQQVVWGQADGIKVLDVLNPQSYREFILDDFEASRIPLWSALAEVPIGPVLLQLTWIPDLTFHDLPAPEDPYAWTSPKLVPQLPADVPIAGMTRDRPEGNLADADWAVQLSGFAAGWDWTINFADHYEDLPVIATEARVDGVSLDTSYARSHTVGGSVSRPFGNVVLRGEFAYRENLPLMGQQADGLPGSVPTDTASALIGLDFAGWDSTWLSLQVLHDRALDSAHRLVRDRREHLISLTADRYFANERIKSRMQLFHSPNDGDGLVRLALQWSVASRVSLTFGVDHFYGARHGLFGQFIDADRVSVGVQLSR